MRLELELELKLEKCTGENLSDVFSCFQSSTDIFPLYFDLQWLLTKLEMR